MLKPGKQNVGANVKTEMEHGKPQKQAVAITLRKAGVPKKGAKKPEKKGNPY